MNLQRMAELLQAKGWTEGEQGGWDFFYGLTHAYEGWQIVAIDTDDATIHIYHSDLEAYWSCLEFGSRSQLFDFAEKTIRDVTREYAQSPGQLSLF